jgi:hypothetical protein
MVLAMVATSATIAMSASPAMAYPSKPATDQSFYVTTTNGLTAYNYGCSAGNYDKTNGNTSTEMVVDFGAQKSDFSGAYLPASSTFISNANIINVAESFGNGYYQCSNSTTKVYLDLSTNNDGSQVTSAAGAAWGNLVTTVSNYAAANDGGQVIIQGANDIEPSWSSFSAASSWASGFASTFGGLYVNTASADGCPQTSHGNGGCNNGWNQYDVWYLAYGYGPATVSPQIYYSAQASQWYQLSLYGANSQSKAIHFLGVLDEYPDDTTTYTATSAWNALVGDIYGSSSTAFTPKYSMEVVYE